MIALVTHLWDPAEGGRERYLADLARELACSGYAVRVFCERVSHPRTDPSVPVTTVRTTQRLVRRLGAWRAAYPGCPVLSSRPLPGATHCQLHSGIYAFALAAEREAFDSRLRRLFFRPALALNRRRSALLRVEEKVLSGPNPPRLMVWSGALREMVAERYGIPAEEIRVRAPGVDLAVFRPAARQATPAVPRGVDLLLLFAAQNFALKGLRPALEALREARRLGVRARLLVAGRGPIGPFHGFARRLGLSEEVEFLGPVSRERLASLYRACDALLHPTFYDPFSLVALEALASGCPVITTRRNGVSEWMESGREGFVLDEPRDVTGFARCLAALAERPSRAGLRNAAAALGRRLSLEDHVTDVIEWLGLPLGRKETVGR